MFSFDQYLFVKTLRLLQEKFSGTLGLKDLGYLNSYEPRVCLEAKVGLSLSWMTPRGNTSEAFIAASSMFLSTCFLWAITSDYPKVPLTALR